MTMALVLGMTGSLFVVSAQSVPPAILYRVLVLTYFVGPLCVGDVEPITVVMMRRTTVNGRQYDQLVTGGEIAGIVADKQVGEFEPADDEIRDVGGAPRPEATFPFRAKSPGSTRIEFFIARTGEELRVGDDEGFYTDTDEIEVEVQNCFDAYTSGLATVFDEKDMDGLDEPFLLAGHKASSTIAGSTQVMFFIPNPQNRTTGGYAFVDTAWAVADPRARCTAYVSGHYDVVFYPDEEHVVEGDLLMKGSGVAVCTGSTVAIDYQNTPGFQIGFKPRPALP